MIYWLYFDISFMRVLTYYSFRSYCDKLNQKIINKALSKYEEKHIIEDI